jgi:PAS domain S-box-containing protein
VHLDVDLLQDVCDRISPEINAVVTIFKSRGEVVASSLRSRIGHFHEGAARIMAGEVDFYAVDAEEAARSTAMLEGCTAAVDFEGERAFCVAVAAPIERARQYIGIVRYWVLSHLRAAKTQEDLQHEVAENEQRFRDIAESAGDWIWEMDGKLRFTYLSDRFFEIFQIAPKDIIGKTRQEFAGRELNEPHWQRHYAELNAHKSFRDFAYSVAVKDGRVRYIQISGKPVLDRFGSFSGYRGTGADVTELKIREKEVEEVRQRMAEAIETISACFALYDAEDRLVVCNSHYRDLMYHSPESPIRLGDTFEQIFRRAVDRGLVPEAKEDPEAFIARRIASHLNPGEPFVRRRGDGRWLLVSERKTSDQGIVVVYSDVTELKRREIELEATQKRFRDVAEVAGDWIWEMDAELRFTFLSERFFDIFPVAREGILGKSRHEFAGKSMEAPHWLAHYRDLNARKAFRAFEYDLTLADGQLRYIQISGKPVFDENGEFKGYRGTGTDITELRLREQQLAFERERLRRASVEVSEKNAELETLASKLAKYLSPQVYASIFANNQTIQLASQRKKLTVFFSDIVNFTETTDKMESEDLTQLLNHYLTEMSAIALDYGATIDKYIGDAIMIFFGDPESQGISQDALACVKMAVAMRKRVQELASEWREAGIELPLTCRIGINTGYCTVGNFGGEERMDYTIVGGAVNLASRLEHVAPPGEILISYETYAHIKDEVDCKEEGQITVKGIAYPITTYRVIDVLDELASEEKAVRARLPHLSLNLDPSRMPDEERLQATAVLQAAIERIGRAPSLAVADRAGADCDEVKGTIHGTDDPARDLAHQDGVAGGGLGPAKAEPGALAQSAARVSTPGGPSTSQTAAPSRGGPTFTALWRLPDEL